MCIAMAINLGFWVVIVSIESTPSSPQPHLVCLSLSVSLSLLADSTQTAVNRVKRCWFPSHPPTPSWVNGRHTIVDRSVPPHTLFWVISWVTWLHGVMPCDESSVNLLQHWNTKDVDQGRNASRRTKTILLYFSLFSFSF
jgi:hypothetical protein